MESSQTARKLKMLGMVLFLLGLITGFVIMKFVNPRQGLAAHLEGVMNGTFLVVAGFVWNELLLLTKAKKLLYGLLLYGTFANWFFTVLGAVWGTSRITPLAGAGFSGNEWQENIVATGLATVGLTMVISLLLLIYGLRGKIK
jgi:(hydroxyamino)benzene mutase